MNYHGILFDEDISQPFRIGLPAGTRIQIAIQLAPEQALVNHLYLQPAYTLARMTLETR